MEHLSGLFAIAVVSLLAAISPGPDFVVVLRNSLCYSRKIGYMTAFGVSLGLLIHLTYTLVGIGVLIAESAFVYNVIKYAGISYLFYLGLSGVASSFKKTPSIDLNYAQSSSMISSTAALKQGFLTNALNPKCAIFFISLFSQFIDSSTPLFLRFEYALVNWTMSLGWFLFLSYLITGKRLMAKVDQFRLYIDRVMGAALMLLSMKMLLV